MSAESYAFFITISGIENDANLDNNQSSFSITLTETEHDIVLSAFDAPLEARSQAEEVALPVTIENGGANDETVEFILTDLTSESTIGSESFTLDAGEKSAVSSTWNTESASLGTHQLEARVQPVTGETAITNNVSLAEYNYYRARSRRDGKRGAVRSARGEFQRTVLHQSLFAEYGCGR
ncbi:MAG: hypothetical protein KQH63_10710 [Desulfobulbaceae bacterium]|nr:hypothetical protein [Desulfobulbaceae bacterium]